MMDSQSTTQTITYQQQRLGMVRTLSRERGDQDAFASKLEERAWGQTAIRSLAKYWDTEEEDEAWAYLQKET